MAIDRGSLDLWTAIKDQLPRRPAVLEIGRANWFGDVDPCHVPEITRNCVQGASPDLREMMKTGTGLYHLAEMYYHGLLDPVVLDAVDNGAPRARRWDLNQPLPLTRTYDVVINTGTAEHVFDQRRVFETVHDHTAVGGVMVHAFPVDGCTDHGFYNYHPCLLTALADANHYTELARVDRELRGDRVLHLAWRRTRPGAFVVPQQGPLTAGIMGGKFTAMKEVMA